MVAHDRIRLIGLLTESPASAGLSHSRVVPNRSSAAERVPTEASLMAVRCARGERGEVPIRGGRRSVELTPLGALTFFFDPVAAAKSAVPLATAVSPASSLEEAREALNAIGVKTELELERERARARE